MNPKYVYNCRKSRQSIRIFNSILDPRLKQLTDSKVSEWRSWFDTRLDDAIEAASAQQHPEIERKPKLNKLFHRAKKTRFFRVITNCQGIFSCARKK